MSSKPYWECSEKELRRYGLLFKVMGIILLLLGLLLCIVTLPLGVIICLFSAWLLFLSKKYKKTAQQKHDGTFVYPLQKYSASTPNTSYITQPNNGFPLSDYVIIDFETTGLNPKTDRIIEIGALKIHNGEIVDTFSSFINPQKNITKKITDLTGITTEMLIDAPFEDDIFPRFVNFINGLPVTAYNLRFDTSFFNSALERLGDYSLAKKMQKVKLFDTLEIARQSFPELENHKLQTVVNHIDPNFEQTHRALDDCRAVQIILNNVTINNIQMVR